MTEAILLPDRKASTLPEAAMVLGILLPMLMGGIDVGLMMWTKGTMQSVAALTARCRSVNVTPCDSDGGAAQYGYTLANAWLSSTMVPGAGVASSPAGTVSSTGTPSTSNVTVTVASSTKCNNNGPTLSSPRSYEMVTITTKFWVAAVLHPLAGPIQTQIACYPH